jgi:predicted RNase H-like nuclease (RuvC/YqgF family)
MKDFASQFTLLQAKNVRLQGDAQSKSAQLDQAVKIAATARQEVDLLKKELGQLKKKLKEEEKDKEDLLRNSTTALLCNFIAMSSNLLLFSFIDILLFFTFCRIC